MNAKKFALSLVGILILIASLVWSTPAISKPLSTIDASQFRAPVVGVFEITRVGGKDSAGNPVYSTCSSHRGRNGAIYMDINGYAGANTDAGIPVYTSGDGTIDVVAYNIDNPVGGADVAGFGNYVDLHSHGVSFIYAHLAKVYVTNGQSVRKGQLIGLMGSTGDSTSAHLHWDVKPLGTESFDVYSINGINEVLSAPCGSVADGEVNAPNIESNPYNSCSAFASNNYPWVALFDNKDCQGNMLAIAPPYAYPVTISFHDQNGFNDKTRSIYVPGGWAIKVGGNVNDNPYVLTKCFTSTQTDLDSVYYDQGARIGYDWGIPDHRNGWDMISYIAVGQSGGCSALASAVGGMVGSYSESGIGESGSGGSYDAIRMYENTDFAGGNYGWHEATSNWFNLDAASGPDYLNNQASSIQVQTGWSLLAANDFNGQGAQRCFTSTVRDLQDASYYDASNVNNTISSVKVFNNSDCGGIAPAGVSPNDMVTIHKDPNYWDDQYGWHDPGPFPAPNWLNNSLTSIGVVPGWSIALYEGANQTGGMACLTASDPDLSPDRLNNDGWINDNIESVYVYHDTTCGGLGAPPNINLSYEITNPGNRSMQATFSWSNAAPKWHILYWGDGSEYSVFGSSGSITATHQYNAGDYTISFEVYGNDRSVYSVTEPVSMPLWQCGSAPSEVGVVVYEFENCSYVNGADYVELTAPGLYNLADYGLDNEATSIHFPQDASLSARLYEGPNGTGQSICTSWDMWYMPIDNWPDQSPMENSISSVEVFDTIGCTPLPVMNMSHSFLDPHGQIQLEVSWSGAADGSWQIINWGDGTDYGVQGASGSANPTHWYPGPGTYTITFTVTNAAPDWGQYQITDQVTVGSWQCGSAVAQNGVVLYRFSTCAYRDSGDYQEFTSDGFYNLTGLDNQATSLHVPSGKSVRLYEGPNQIGDSMCVSWDMWAMEIDSWPLGGSLNDSVSSLQVFSNTTCTP